MSTAKHHPLKSNDDAGNGARPDRQPIASIVPLRPETGRDGPTRHKMIRATELAIPRAEVIEAAAPLLHAFARSPTSAGSDQGRGNEGKTPPWEAKDRQQIRWVFRHRKAWEIYNFHLGGGTWMAGGCWVAAEAIRRVYGGNLVALCSARGPEHIVVESRGYCIDSRGSALRTDKFASNYSAGELVNIVRTTPHFSSKAKDRGIPYVESAVDQLTPALLGRWGSP